MGRKTTVWIFQATTESLLIAAQNSAVRTNYVKAKIDNVQQNSKFRLCGDRDETINHMISECSKLVQKEYKTRHDCVGKVIYWELCKKFKVDRTNKWYMHNPESVPENETHKILLDFEIQMNHLTSTWRPDLVIVNKKENLPNSRLYCVSRSPSKIERKRKERWVSRPC